MCSWMVIVMPEPVFEVNAQFNMVNCGTIVRVKGVQQGFGSVVTKWVKVAMSFGVAFQARWNEIVRMNRQEGIFFFWEEMVNVADALVIMSSRGVVAVLAHSLRVCLAVAHCRLDKTEGMGCYPKSSDSIWHGLAYRQWRPDE